MLDLVANEYQKINALQLIHLLAIFGRKQSQTWTSIRSTFTPLMDFFGVYYFLFLFSFSLTIFLRKEIFFWDAHF